MWKILPNMVFSPRFGGGGGGNGGVLSMHMQVILDSSFARRVQPLYGAGRKESSGTGLALALWQHSISGIQSSHFRY